MKHLTKFNESKKDSHDDIVQNILDYFQSCIDDGMTYDLIDFTKYSGLSGFNGAKYKIDFQYKLFKNFYSKNDLTKLGNYSNSLLKNKSIIDNIKDSILMVRSMYSDIEYTIETYNTEDDYENFIRVVFDIQN